MATGFDRDALLDAFDQIARAAVAAGTKLQIAVYGGSALMLASNFRFATEDVDIAEIGGEWPQWLRDVAAKIAAERGWGADWLNDGVSFHLSKLATSAADHLEFGTFPRDGSAPGLVVSVPAPEYLLALKLKAMRVTDAVRGDTERLDILNLMQVVGVDSVDRAIALLAKYFRSAQRLRRSSDFCSAT
ncbi:hypothetical protein BH11PSE4_BH11PSE4_16190 [soil metagenome]